MTGIVGTALGFASLAVLNAQSLPMADHSSLMVTLCTADGRDIQVELPIDFSDEGGEDENCATACHAMCKRSRLSVDNESDELT